jgi:hypothetical protein
MPPALPMLRMLPAEPILRMLPALPMLRMLPALSRLPTERKLSRLQMLSPFARFRINPRLSIPRMVGRFVFGALLFLVVGYSAWWIAWYSGTQSGSGSTLPTPPYANVIANQGT